MFFLTKNQISKVVMGFQQIVVHIIQLFIILVKKIFLFSVIQNLIRLNGIGFYNQLQVKKIIILDPVHSYIILE